MTERTNPATSASRQRILTRASSGTIFQTADVDYEVLCSEISNSQQAYLRGTIKAHTLDPKLPWHRHKETEFIYVISGILVLHTELYEPTLIKAGDSILFDSSMGHHSGSQGRKDEQILIKMSLQDYENVSDTLRKPNH